VGLGEALFKIWSAFSVVVLLVFAAAAWSATWDSRRSDNRLPYVLLAVIVSAAYIWTVVAATRLW